MRSLFGYLLAFVVIGAILIPGAQSQDSSTAEATTAQAVETTAGAAGSTEAATAGSTADVATGATAGATTGSNGADTTGAATTGAAADTTGAAAAETTGAAAAETTGAAAAETTGAAAAETTGAAAAVTTGAAAAETTGAAAAETTGAAAAETTGAAAAETTGAVAAETTGAAAAETTGAGTVGAETGTAAAETTAAEVVGTGETTAAAETGATGGTAGTAGTGATETPEEEDEGLCPWNDNDLTDFERLTWMSKHNSLRGNLALGLVKNGASGSLRKANQMYELEYSCDLEQKALCRAKLCSSIETTAAPEDFHENYAIATNPSGELASVGSRNMQKWWSEITERAEGIDQIQNIWYSHMNISNFAKMASDQTTDLGCAVHKCDSEGIAVVVCLYETKLTEGGKLYNMGPTCNKCPGGKASCVNGLCPNS